jgi:hypothetical protein
MTHCCHERAKFDRFVHCLVMNAHRDTLLWLNEIFFSISFGKLVSQSFFYSERRVFSQHEVTEIDDNRVLFIQQAYCLAFSTSSYLLNEAEIAVEAVPIFL